jgi:quinol monooxygenase YgiN
MSIMVLSEMRVYDAEVDDDYRTLRRIVGETERFDGCERLDLLADEGDPAKLVLLVQWASDAHHDAYRAWRAEHGVSDLLALLAQPSVLRRFKAA